MRTSLLLQLIQLIRSRIYWSCRFNNRQSMRWTTQHEDENLPLSQQDGGFDAFAAPVSGQFSPSSPVSAATPPNGSSCSTNRNTDIIVVLEAGKIIETGLHDELCADGESKLCKLMPDLL
eukprot:3040048-Ditylum_brightwellii.AAC.1